VVGPNRTRRSQHRTEPERAGTEQNPKGQIRSITRTNPEIPLRGPQRLSKGRETVEALRGRVGVATAFLQWYQRFLGVS